MRSLIEGWNLTLLATALLLAMTAALFATGVDGIEGTRLVIRWTARTSVLLFLSAFTASALFRLAPGHYTRWQVRNRRYIGLSFAVSHTIHLGAILALASQDQVLFWQLTNYGTLISGGLAYGFIFAMALTSFNRTAAMLGPRAWRWLHSAGAWYIWMSFVFTFGKRAVMNIDYLPAMVLIFVALGIRILARLRRPVSTVNPS